MFISSISTTHGQREALFQAFVSGARFLENELRRSSKFERNLTSAGSFSHRIFFYILRKRASLGRSGGLCKFRNRVCFMNRDQEGFLNFGHFMYSENACFIVRLFVTRPDKLDKLKLWPGKGYPFSN
jgi:hypothetical protein